MKWLTKKRFGKLAVGFGVLLVVLVLFGYAIHHRSKSSVENYKQQLRAAGEKLTVAELIPPRPPEEENSAPLFSQAATLDKVFKDLFTNNFPLAMHMVMPGRAMIAWQQPDIRNDEATNTWDEAETAMEHRAGELELYQQILQHPTLDFAVNYEVGLRDLELPNLAFVKRSAQLLSAAALCALHRGDAASAVTNLHTLLFIVKGWRDEPLTISVLVRIAITQIGFAAQWELLQSPGLTDEQLALLQRDWSELEFVQAFENAIQMERALGDDFLQGMRNSPSPRAYLGGVTGSGSTSGSWLDWSKEVWGNVRRKAGETLWQMTWSYTDQLRALQGAQVIIVAVRQIRTNGYFKDALAEKNRKLKALGLDASAKTGSWLSEKLDMDEFRDLLSTPGLDKLLSRMMAVEISRQFAVTILALKRHQLKHGDYPDTLSALVPEFLSSTPRDPVDGLPLRYHKNSDGTFLLYSVGEDGKDDGGDVTAVKSSMYYWQRCRDWVLPQPARLADVQAYYALNARTLNPDQLKAVEQAIEQMLNAAAPKTNAAK